MVILIANGLVNPIKNGFGLLLRNSHYLILPFVFEWSINNHACVGSIWLLYRTAH
jgi:hypothetical protein